MSKKVIVTMSQQFVKTIQVEVDPKDIEGMSSEEISEYLQNEWSISDEEETRLFDKAEMESIASDDEVDEDRYDIYEGDEQVYGGHL